MIEISNGMQFYRALNWADQFQRRQKNWGLVKTCFIPGAANIRTFIMGSGNEAVHALIPGPDLYRLRGRFQ